MVTKNIENQMALADIIVDETQQHISLKQAFELYATQVHIQ